MAVARRAIAAAICSADPGACARNSDGSASSTSRITGRPSSACTMSTRQYRRSPRRAHSRSAAVASAISAGVAMCPVMSSGAKSPSTSAARRAPGWAPFARHGRSPRRSSRPRSRLRSRRRRCMAASRRRGHRQAVAWQAPSAPFPTHFPAGRAACRSTRLRPVASRRTRRRPAATGRRRAGRSWSAPRAGLRRSGPRGTTCGYSIR